MTNSEAIGILRHIGGSYGDVSKYHTAVNLAISALEKQEGRKPQITPWNFVDKSYDYSCPKCGRPFISNVDGEWCGGHKLNFCDQCGQRIDWSDEE